MTDLKLFTAERFITESGFELIKPQIAYHTWGTLNENRDNVLLVCHAFSGNSDVKAWFPGLFNENSIYNQSKVVHTKNLEESINHINS